jgi:hypothetical protein
MHAPDVPPTPVNESTWLPRNSWLEKGLTNYKDVLARAVLVRGHLMVQNHAKKNS